MDLSNLTPAKGSIKNRKRIARGEGSKKVALQQEVTKELNLVLDIQEK